ncbi:MAG: isochorismatase family protein [Caulobacterales bacterium]
MFVTPSASSRRSIAWSRPWLICLDLQREYVVPGRPLYDEAASAVTDACARVMRRARREGWRIVHTQLRRSVGLFAAEGRFGAPIAGLRPLISEPVYLRQGLSAFSNADFAQEMREARGEKVFLIGFSMSDTALATALACVDLGLDLVLVEDALGSGPNHRAAAEIARDILEPYVEFTSTRELLKGTSVVEYAQ